MFLREKPPVPINREDQHPRPLPSALLLFSEQPKGTLLLWTDSLAGGRGDASGAGNCEGNTRNPRFRGKSMPSDSEPAFTPPARGGEEHVGIDVDRLPRSFWLGWRRPLLGPILPPGPGGREGWRGAGRLQVPSVEAKTPPSDSQGPALFKLEPRIISGAPKAWLFGSRVTTCPPRWILRVGGSLSYRKGVWVEKRGEI